MAGAVVALLFLAVIVIVIKFFQTQKSREVEKYQDPAFLKNLRKIDEFLEQIAHFNDYITWKNRDEILKKYEKTHSFFQGKSKYYKKEPSVRRFNDTYENFAEFIKNYNEMN